MSMDAPAEFYPEPENLSGAFDHEEQMMDDEQVSASPLRTSRSVAAIAPALVKAQAAIEAVVKDKTGTIQGKDGRAGYSYKYSDLGSVIEAVKGPLNANDICFLQAPSRVPNGVSVTTRLMHKSGEYVEQDTFIPGAFSTPQSFGSALTYGKRYGLQALTGLPSEDDDGKQAEDDTVRAVSKAKRQSDPVLDALKAEAKKGMNALQVKWDEIGQAERKRLKDELDDLKQTAADFDAKRDEVPA